VDGPVQACVVCHCESCRRQCSAPMTAYIGVLDDQWRWLNKPPKVFNSSPGVERTFCDHCGTPLSFRSKKMSDVMHFFAAAMDEPEKFAPTLHVA
ncbi:GFA family protein, partial [Mesorhizobium sp. M4B.F.Ca.ET.215.01.1.1]|uniref:GFA family protein n=1 Tax=Mesorhizobium sp. M4B.F.Ca.ET.215.01.1.1 TaxID=2563956 RepID=UPI001FE1D851